MALPGPLSSAPTGDIRGMETSLTLFDGGCCKRPCGVRGCCPLTLTILILLQGICLDTVHSPARGAGGREAGRRVFCEPGAPRAGRGTGGFVIAQCESLFTFSLPYLSLTYVTPLFFTFFSVLLLIGRCEIFYCPARNVCEKK